MTTLKTSLVGLTSLALFTVSQVSHGQASPGVPGAQRPAPSAPPNPKPRPSMVDPIAKGHLDLGKAYFYAADWDAAIENFRKAIGREPDLAQAHLLMGEALYQRKDYKEAVRSLQRALLDPNISRQADTYKLLGAVYEDQRNYRDAEANFKKAFALDPQDPGKHNSLAYVYALQGKNLAEALDLVNFAIKSTSDEFLLFHYLDTRAWVYYHMGKYAEAEKDALACAQMAPKLLKSGLLRADAGALKEFHYHLGEIYLRLNKADLARREFHNALRIDKNFSEALEGLRKIH